MAIQLPLAFNPPSSWKAPRLEDLPTDWGKGRIGVDTETRDEFLTTLGPGVRRGGYIVGFCLAFEDGPSYYLPIRHGGGGNMDPERLLAYLRHCSDRFEGTVVGANLGYDLDFLAEEGITFPKAAWFRDVQIAEPLLDELQFSYSLASIAERRGLLGKDEAGLMEALSGYGFKGKSAKNGLWALPAADVGPYGEQDARLPLTILRRQEREIEDQDLWGVYDLESRLLPVLVRMRRRGVAVSLDRLQKVESWAREQQRLAIDAANCLITRRLDVTDITKTTALAAVLRDLGVALPKTPTGKDSVTAAVLNSLDHPIGEHLRRAKKMETLRSTFCDGVRKHLINGRIHTTFNQLKRQKDDESGETEGAAFGRLSSSQPNLQNQPARDEEIGPMWRSIYVPDEGGLWAALDYSQQEPRQAVDAAIELGERRIGERAWASANEAARRYREDPTMDFHQMMADMAGIKRKPAKNIFLGLSYGMGGPKLCRDLGLPTVWRLQWQQQRRRGFTDLPSQEAALAKAEDGRRAGFDVKVREVAGPEGQQLMDLFDERVPFVRRTAQYYSDLAKKQGYITTLSGRRCRFPLMRDGTYDWLHKAFNRRIQGGSADQTKMAVVELDSQGFPLQLQVHDEVDLTVPDRATAERGARIMETVVELRVPFKVDVEVGPSWGEAA